jgi:hypothetical protein
VIIFVIFKHLICLFWQVVEDQSPILEKIDAPKCFNTSYPSIRIGSFTSKG